ncbi:MAG: transcriptional regulator [Flavobacterium sp. BFFFF1]|uniref:winged helix-turn-helix transcriptional regulator n=1 Tax=unclassified Flavobacterium TaxID=196869 RepID=UPI000BC6FBFD|nr:MULTISPECIES: helix-turn-helix domain-containing protein [unclassified Flavobacterium]OYU80706.1 MAG: transcriptional regulator [Flavobacterium sp. BFFFF1]
MMDKPERNRTECQSLIRPVHDALEVLQGKWKLPIIIALSFGSKRFSEMAREIPKITDRMLSKELRDMEVNGLVKRTVHDSIPVVVEYSLTEYGQSLDPVIIELRKWGMEHRRRAGVAAGQSE